jgi:hypothetical protein
LKAQSSKPVSRRHTQTSTDGKGGLLETILDADDTDSSDESVRREGIGKLKGEKGKGKKI